MGIEITGLLGQLLADNALARAGASALLAFLFVQGLKIWPMGQTSKSPNWRPRVLAVGLALALNVVAEVVQMEQSGASPLWWRAGLLGFAAGTLIVMAYPLVKPMLPKGGGDGVVQ